MSNIRKITLNVIFLPTTDFLLLLLLRKGTPGVNLRNYVNNCLCLDFLPLHSTLHFFLLAYPPDSVQPLTSSTGENTVIASERTQIYGCGLRLDFQIQGAAGPLLPHVA